MRYLGLNLLIGAWLLLSAFVLPHTPATAAATVAAGFAVPLLAALAARTPAARVGLVVLAGALGLGALLLPGIPGPAAISNALAAAALAALSLVSPVHAATVGRGKPATDPDWD